MNRSRLARVVVIVLAVGSLPFVVRSRAVRAVTNVMTIEHDVPAGGMTSDRFTWYDSAGQPRVAVLAHNDGATGPGGTHGGELRELRYETPGGTRVVAASSSGASGFGYVVSHPDDGSESCIAGPDSSTLGHFIGGSFTRVFEGRHHAIFRFTQSYPRYCATTGVPGAPINVPVTIDWVFATGRDHPLWAVTWDLSGVAADTLSDDSRGPYGELLFDGAASEGAHSEIAGVGWGDRYKFVSTTNPVTYNSAWTWNTANTIPYVKLWTTNVDATMGTVQTQTILQQDAGGYFGTSRWATTSGDGNACVAGVNFGDATHSMPCDFNWPYQSINYSLNNGAPNTTTNNTRLAWGTNFGFLGQTSYHIQGSAYWGGPITTNDTASGWPQKSYSTFVVVGRHSVDPVGAQVAQIENVQQTNLTATIGSVATSGPAGANRTDTVTYAPAGWNHVYAAWALQAAGNAIDANWNVASGSLANPLVIVSGWTAGVLPTTVRLNGTPLAQDVDYFPSLGPSQQLWITLNATLSGATNHLQISTTATATPTGTTAATPTATATAPPTPTTGSGTLSLDRTSLRFGAVVSGGTFTSTTPPQTVVITAPGAWSASSFPAFVSVAPSTGNGRGTLTVQMASTAGLPVSGATQATITVTAAGVSNSPQTIAVSVQVSTPGTTAAPFGFFDTPADGTTGAQGAIGVTGWALDDIAVSRVQLYRDPVAGDAPPGPTGKIYIGDATIVAGARPDVEALFPGYPLAYRTAWSYMLLTNLLPTVSTGAPAGGIGTFTLYVYVTDVEGNVTLLPSHTFTCDNSAASKPFGTIDTPLQGETVSGTINNFGWVLAPKDGFMPTDGSTIVVYVDNVPRGTVTYGGFRTDIATLFPGYSNTNGAIGVFTIDTTQLANGVHTIAWSATDNRGRADGIGSRYFTVVN